MSNNEVANVSNGVSNLYGRRQRALQRLEAQLKVNSKSVHTNMGGTHYMTYVPLTDGDVLRIKKEIAILKAKL